MVKILVDNRERNLALMEVLSEMGAELEFSSLPVGDYILSDRVCVERKGVSDFENSIMDGRLFDQVERLKSSFPKPIIIIEGDGSEYRLSSNVILGTIVSLYIDYNVQVMLSANEEETAGLLYMIAKREQDKKERIPRLKGAKRAFTEEEWQRLIISSMPGIGPKLSHEVLRKFKSIKNVANASIEELMDVNKIGKKKAKRIYDILNFEYKE
ncbi:MAG: ERCC4 domain-containing protein [Candidatus Micrarchaeia archaeon]|jgi:Fanconi anemia group M protein